MRKPAHVHNYVHNAQMVVDALAGPILNMDLCHITGEAIVRGGTPLVREALAVAELRNVQRIWLIGDPGLFDLASVGADEDPCQDPAS